MRRRYALALVLATALIFALGGVGIGYELRGGADQPSKPAGAVVTSRTATQSGSGKNLNFCLSYYDENPPARLPSNLVTVQGNTYTLCWYNYGSASDCWASAKIGDVPPDICR